MADPIAVQLCKQVAAYAFFNCDGEISSVELRISLIRLFGKDVVEQCKKDGWLPILDLRDWRNETLERIADRLDAYEGTKHSRAVSAAIRDELQSDESPPVADDTAYALSQLLKDIRQHARQSADLTLAAQKILDNLSSIQDREEP